MNVKLDELLAALEKLPQTFPRFVLPDGDRVPAHAHVTEVGYVVKNFIDCGGEIGKTESVLLQTHVGNDTGHRLTSDRFAKILRMADRVLPPGEVGVEVEYDCCVVSQYPIVDVTPVGEHLDIVLGRKRTKCFAQQRTKQESSMACCVATTACC
jgi:hypothetical protein